MKLAAKALAAFITILVAGMILVIGSVSYLHEKSRRDITRIVSEISSGTSISTVIDKLGKPSQICRNQQSIETMSFGRNSDLYSKSDLYMFVHDAIPYRWILVYTRKDSSEIERADWADM